MCTSPLFRFNQERFDYLRSDTYGQIRYPLFIGTYRRFQDYFSNWEDLLYRKVYQRIPCGQCLECKINRSKQWADRCVLESLNYSPDQCTFITLTIDNDHLYSEFISNGMFLDTGEIFHVPEVRHRYFQLFMKKLRFEFKGKLRFFMCGEYGSKNFRPHYHLLCFGLDFHDLKPLSESVAGCNGESLFSSALIDKCWNKGIAAVAPFSWASAAYVARYSTKKLLTAQERKDKERIIIYDGHEFTTKKDFQKYLATGELPRAEYSEKSSMQRFLNNSRPFNQAYIQASRRGGIASSNYTEDFYQTDSIAIPNGYKSHVCRPFAYYDKLLKERNPVLYNQVHEQRSSFSLNSELAELYSSDEPYDDRLARKSQQLKNKLNALRREL